MPGHPTENNAVVTSIYQSSLASAFLYLHLAAASLGFASQWYSAASRPEAEREIRSIIVFPDSLTLYDMMVLGYPAVPPNPKELRSLAGMIHYKVETGQNQLFEELAAESACRRIRVFDLTPFFHLRQSCL